MFPFLRGDTHAQKCAVLSINSGHAVALPAAPHFIVVLRWKDSACWTPATLLSVRISAFFYSFFPPRIQMQELRVCAWRGGLWMCHAGPAAGRHHGALSSPPPHPAARTRQLRRAPSAFLRRAPLDCSALALAWPGRWLGSASESRSGRRGHFGSHLPGSGAPRTRGRIQPAHWPCSLLCLKLDFRRNGDLFRRSDALELSFS